MNNVTTIKDGFKDIEQMLQQGKGKLSKLDMDTTASGTSTTKKNKKYPKETAPEKKLSSENESSNTSEKKESESAKSEEEEKPKRARDRKAADKAQKEKEKSESEESSEEAQPKKTTRDRKPAKKEEKPVAKKIEKSKKKADVSQASTAPHAGFDKEKHEISAKNKSYFTCPKALELVKDIGEKKKVFATQAEFEEKVIKKMNAFFGSEVYYVQFNEEKRAKYVQVCSRYAGCPFNFWCTYDSEKKTGPPEKIQFSRFIN